MKKSTKNILLVHSSNDLYGASKILITIIEILIKSGYSIHLILPEEGPLNSHKSLLNVKLSIINLGVFRKKYLSFFGLINRFFFIVRSTIQIKNIINKFEIDLVYSNTSTIISPTFAAQLTKKPSIFHVHEIPYGSNLYTKFLTKLFNLFSNKIIAVSNFTRDFWLKNGVNKSKINVIHNGFNFNFLDKKKLDNNKIIFTNISRIIPYKGHLFLIKLFKELLKSNNNLILQIIGDTLPAYENYLNFLKLKVKEYEIENNVIFLGYKSDIKSILNNSNFFIHTPINPDPFPTVIFEAIESYTPVICTDNGGAREILNNGKNGLLINSNELEKSKNKILNYIVDYKKQNEHLKKSIDYVSRNFNYNKFETKILKVIS